jgi:hypothetical protein
MNARMSPFGIDKRESRDSDEHPESYPVIIALDVTGSMGSIPTYLIKAGLPKIMQSIIDSGIRHPQVLFMGIGDAECDSAPLQVGQFESSDDLLDYWLENLWLEGGGGSNDGESYFLAWDFAAGHTVTDSWEKRKKKGCLITIGDELPLNGRLADRDLHAAYGVKSQGISGEDLFANLSACWNVYHIHTNNRELQGGKNIAAEWIKYVTAEGLIVENNRENIAAVITRTILNSYGGGTSPSDIHAEDDMML